MPAIGVLSRVRTAAFCGVMASVLLAGCGGGSGGGGGGGEAPPAPTPVDLAFRVTPATPFAAGCDGVPVTGTLYVNAEVEPMVAVNPRNASHLLGVWQQDRWSNGGARGLATGVSTDGGRTWTPALAAFTRCSGGTSANGGDYARASDPWVTFAADGTAYQIAIAFNGVNFAPNASGAVLVSRSADGGRTWANPVTLIRDGAAAFNDKEAIAADAVDARYVYATWDRLTVDGHGPSWFSRTADGGATWEAARAIYDPGVENQTVNNIPLSLPDGALVTFLTRLDVAPDQSVTATLVLLRSLDRGVHWSAPITVARAQALGTKDPDSGRDIRDAAYLGAIAVGPAGQLAVAWQDARFSGGVRDGIAFTVSRDGGLTWTPPVRVNADPGVQAFVPSVAVRADGTFGVSYYDLRNNTADAATLPADYWLARSADGLTWRETHVAGPFDFAQAPFADGLFLGDYQALATIGNLFVPFYALVNGGDAANRTDVFASLMTSATAAAAPPSAQRTVETVMRAETAEELAPTPEVKRMLTASVERAMRRRVPGWTPRGIVAATAGAE